jgi:hypothetical protein
LFINQDSLKKLINIEERERDMFEIKEDTLIQTVILGIGVIGIGVIATGYHFIRLVQTEIQYRKTPSTFTYGAVINYRANLLCRFLQLFGSVTLFSLLIMEPYILPEPWNGLSRSQITRLVFLMTTVIPDLTRCTMETSILHENATFGIKGLPKRTINGLALIVLLFNGSLLVLTMLPIFAEVSGVAQTVQDTTEIAISVCVAGGAWSGISYGLLRNMMKKANLKFASLASTLATTRLASALLCTIVLAVDASRIYQRRNVLLPLRCVFSDYNTTDLLWIIAILSILTFIGMDMILYQLSPLSISSLAISNTVYQRKRRQNSRILFFRAKRNRSSSPPSVVPAASLVELEQRQKEGIPLVGRGNTGVASVGFEEEDEELDELKFDLRRLALSGGGANSGSIITSTPSPPPSPPSIIPTSDRGRESSDPLFVLMWFI